MRYNICDYGAVAGGAVAFVAEDTLAASYGITVSDGGVLVGGKRTKGVVDYIDLKAPHGGSIRIASPWKSGETIDVRLAAGETRRLTR